MSVLSDVIEHTQDQFVKDAPKKMGRPSLGWPHTVATKLDDQSLEILQQIADAVEFKPGRVSSEIMNALLKSFPLEKLIEEIKKAKAEQDVLEAFRMAS